MFRAIIITEKLKRPIQRELKESTEPEKISEIEQNYKKKMKKKAKLYLPTDSRLFAF